MGSLGTGPFDNMVAQSRVRGDGPGNHIAARAQEFILGGVSIGRESLFVGSGLHEVGDSFGPWHHRAAKSARLEHAFPARQGIWIGPSWINSWLKISSSIRFPC